MIYITTCDTGGAINSSVGAVFEAPVSGLYRFLVTSIGNGDEAAPVVLFHNDTQVNFIQLCALIRPGIVIYYIELFDIE